MNCISRTSRNPGITLTIHGNDASANEPIEKNLVYRAIDALRRELKIKSGVEIDLHKKIPAGGGLGGGSSNAAAALLGYLQLTRKRLPLERLIEIATPLGADVPFFLFGGRALGVNKGDEIYPLADIKNHAILVVAPQGIHVPTPDAFRWVNAPPLPSSLKPASQPSRQQLTKPRSNSKLSKFCALCWSSAVSRPLERFRGSRLPASPSSRVHQEGFASKQELQKPCWRVAVRRCLRFSRAQRWRAEPL